MSDAEATSSQSTPDTLMSTLAADRLVEVRSRTESAVSRAERNIKKHIDLLLALIDDESLPESQRAEYTNELEDTMLAMIEMGIAATKLQESTDGLPSETGLAPGLDRVPAEPSLPEPQSDDRSIPQSGSGE